MKDLGELRYFLGIEVTQSPKRIWVLQRQYALNKLSEYGMTSYKPIPIPLEQNVKLSADEGNLVEDTTMYRRIVGSLIYMTITRLDLSYVVGVVSQFMQTPQKPNLDVVKQAHIKVHKTYFAMWNFLSSQKPITSTWIHGC